MGAALSGSLVITAPELFGRLNVMPVIESFLEQNPAVSALALFLSRMTDMTAEGIDVAIRIAPLRNSGFVAHKLGELRRVVCAAPPYLARNLYAEASERTGEPRLYRPQ